MATPPRNTVYISATRSHPGSLTSRRAHLLARMAVLSDLAPFLPCAMIDTGIYASADVAWQCCQAHLLDVLRGHGSLWVLLRDDGTMSGDSAMEVRAWKRASRHRDYIERATWVDWQPRLARYGLTDDWARLTHDR